MRFWLARLAFSALVLSFVLFWTAYQRQKKDGVTGRVVIETLAGAALAAVGLAGVRERHRPSLPLQPDEQLDSNPPQERPGQTGRP